MSTIRKISPALYEMSQLPWAWVRLSELAEIVKLPVDQIWHMYKSLSLSHNGKMNIAWEDNQEEEFEHGSFMYEEDMTALPIEKLQTAFVPAGWATAICKQYQKANS